MEKSKVRMANEKGEKVKMEEERCQRHLEHVQKLTNEKEQLIVRVQQLLKRKSQLQLNKKKIKDNFQQEYKKQRQLWIKGQQERKERWQQKKLQEVRQNTLRGLEPQIQRIVSSSKRDIMRIEQKYEQLRNEYKKQMNSQYESNMREIRRGMSERVESDKLQWIDRSNEQYRRRVQSLQQFYGSERMKLKMAKQS